MKKIFIGIDFSKEKFDATLLQAEGVEERAGSEHKVFDNKAAGFRRLVKWVKSCSGESDTALWLFCGENTGGYSRALCDYLYGTGYAMRNYDHMRLYKSLGRNLERLRELFLYRHDLVKHRTALTVRRGEKKLTQPKSDVSRFMAASGRHLISECSKAIAECDRRIREIIAGDDELRRNFEIVTSVPGVGTQNAVCLMVYTDNFTRFGHDSRKMACYYGVAPFARQSGTSVHTQPHVSPMANRLIKALLTQAALAAVNFSPKMEAYYHRMLQAGKKKPVALNNVKNKLLHVITAMVRKQEKYNPEHDWKTGDSAA